MQESTHSRTTTPIELKSWIDANVDIRKLLKKPSGFEGKSDVDRRRDEFEDRTQVANKLLDQFLEQDAEFTELMGQLSDIKNEGSKAVYRSCLREVLQPIQEEAWARYIHPTNARTRTLVSA